MSVFIQYYSGGNVANFINMGAYQRQTSIKLAGAPVNTKYVLQIWDATDTNKLVDIRQSQNINGVAVFSLGEIMQNYVETARGANTLSPFVSSSSDIPWGNQTYEKAREEIFPYILKVGYDDGINPVEITQAVSGYNVWNAIHNLIDMDSDLDLGYYTNLTLQALVRLNTETASCILNSTNFERGIPLTNRPQVELTDISGNPIFKGGFPSNIIPRNDNRTFGYSIDVPSIEAYSSGNRDVDTAGWSLFFRNDYNNLANVYNTAIGAIRFDWYNGETLVGSNLYENLTTNNAGPDTTPRQGNGVVYPYNVLGLNLGQAFTGDQRYRTVTGTTLFLRPSGLTHYYVYPVATQGDECASTFTGYSDYPSHTPVRVNLREEYFTEHLTAGKGADLRGCTDYTPVLFRWTNTAGYQDHAWFMKKNTYTKNIKRDTFFKDNVDYSITEGSTDPQYVARSYDSNVDIQFNGTTSYNQSMEEIFTATTGYMHEEFAEYLQYMFQSPNITANGRPVQLLTTSWTEKNFAKDKLFQYEVRYKLATPNNLQND